MIMYLETRHRQSKNWMCSLQAQDYTSGLLDRLGFYPDEIIEARGAIQGRGEIKVATVNWTIVDPYII